MPFDEQIMKQTELQKITNRYQDVNENEVKFRGKIPVNIEYENNKQKTPLLGMDWMKRFKLTIGRHHSNKQNNTFLGNGLDEKIQINNEKKSISRD